MMYTRRPFKKRPRAGKFSVVREVLALAQIGDSGSDEEIHTYHVLFRAYRRFTLDELTLLRTVLLTRLATTERSS